MTHKVLNEIDKLGLSGLGLGRALEGQVGQEAIAPKKISRGRFFPANKHLCNAIGDFTAINENEFLVIERDGNQGENAALKKVFKIDISDVDKVLRSRRKLPTYWISTIPTTSTMTAAIVLIFPQRKEIIQPLEPDTYYVRVYPSGGDRTPYRLSLNFI